MGTGSVASGGVCSLGALDPSPGDSEPAGYPTLPDRFPHLTISADVRLHNRGDLVRLLGLDPQAGRCSDDQLLLAAYEKWGESCGRYLLGEFAFAIWDGRRQRVFCCRDHVGFRPFLYWRDGSRFLFASDIRSILTVPGVPRKLNRRKLAGMVVYGGDNYYHEDTFHAGILSLPAGSWLVFDRSGPRWRKYWEPQFRPELVPRKPQEVFEALRELLFDAVDCRVAGSSSAAVELSGGLDSSAVTSIAARCLEKRGRSLLAISAVLPEETRGHFKDERGFIDEFQSWSNIAIRYVTAEGQGPFDSIGDPSRFVVYPLRTSRSYLYEAFEQAALSGGADVLLQGNMGEAGPTCHADRHYTELAVKFRWPSLVRDLLKLREVRGINPFRFLAGRFRDILRPFPGWPAPPFVLLNSDFRLNGKVYPPFHYRGPDVRGYQEAMLRDRLRNAACDPAGTNSTRDTCCAGVSRCWTSVFWSFVWLCPRTSACATDITVI